jgi:uroporphyrinogen III methyltransferase/synthase
MMGVEAVGEICAGCLAAGMDEDTPAAIVENATTNVQRKFIGTVGSLSAIARKYSVESPAVIIIGKVCQFSARYDWFSQKPLLGRRVVVARSKPGALADKLRELGCDVTETPCARIIPLTAPGCPLEGALGVIDRYTWLAFTSSIGISVFFDYLIETGFDIRAICHLKVACVGKETEKELNKRGIKAAYCPAEYSGAALARGLSEMVSDGGKLLIARARDGAEDMPRILAEAGIIFDDAAIYEKIYDPEKNSAAAKKMKERAPDLAAFTSSSAVKAFAEAAADYDYTKIKAVCIGERTAASARSYGMDACVSDEATTASMVNKIKELCL